MASGGTDENNSSVVYLINAKSPRKFSKYNIPNLNAKEKIKLDKEIEKVAKYIVEGRHKLRMSKIVLMGFFKKMYNEEFSKSLLSEAEDTIIFHESIPVKYRKAGIVYVKYHLEKISKPAFWVKLDEIFTIIKEPTESDLFKLSDRLKIDKEVIRRWYDYRQVCLYFVLISP